MRRKQARYAANASAHNVLEASEAVLLKGNWCAQRFGLPSKPLVVELGCGYGDYTLALAAQHTQYNFIGVDLKGARLWRCSQEALALGYQHVAFVRGSVAAMTDWFSSQELQAIYLPFPDPFSKKRQAKHRLTHRHFLLLYKQLLCSQAQGGYVVFKTDDTDLYDFTLEELAFVGAQILYCQDNCQAPPQLNLLIPPAVEPYTHYEKRFRAEGKPIKYVCFAF